MRSRYRAAIDRRPLPFREILAPFVVTRVAVVLVAAAAAATIPRGIACRPCDLSSSVIVNALTRWDGGWYLSVARDGYSYAPGVPSNVTFSPLLPLLMRAGAAVAGRADDLALLVAGLVVVAAALLVALAYLLALGRLEVGDAAARRACLYLLIFPTTVILTALYPTSLFIAAAAGTLVEARRGRWLLAGTLAALGALARPFGVALVVPLVVEALRDRSRRRAGQLIAPLLPLAAFAGWQLYLYRVSGDALVFLHAQQTYGRRPSLPLQEVTDLLDPGAYGTPWIAAAMLAVMTVLVVASWRVLRAPTAAATTALFLATLSSGTLTSFPRYALDAFPALLVLGAVGVHRAIHLGYLTIATGLSVLLTAMFASWYWIG